MTSLFIRTLLVCLLIGISHAKQRTCRIVYPERPNDAPKTAFLFDGVKSFAVTLPSMNLSEVIPLPPGPLTLVMTSEEIRDPKMIPAGAPKVSISENVNDCYLIMMPDPKNTYLPLKINLVDAGDQKLKAGETLWFNFTNHRIVAKLGTTELDVQPASRTISKAPLTASGYYIARFGYKADGTAPLAPITEQSWWHDANHKHLGFMVNTGGKLPRIYYFRDFRISEEEKDSE